MKRKNILILCLCLFTICSTLLGTMMITNAGAPEGWRNIQDFYIFKDKAVSGWSGCGGDELELENSGLPVDTTQSFENLPSLRLNLQKELKSGWMSIILCLADWNCHDVTQYVANGYLEFNVKGKNGGENFKIGASDHVTERATGVEHTVTKSIGDYCKVTTDWQHVKIPLKHFLDPSLDMDPYNVKAIVLDRVTNDPFCVWINQIKLTSPDKEKAYPSIKVNQVGFLENTEKYAFVTGFEDDFQATVGTLFQVKKVSDNSIAYNGKLTLVTDYDSNDSGEKVLKAEFDDLKQPGEYYITVSADGIDKSPKFKIGNDIFKPLLADSLKYLYYQRANIDLEDKYSAGFTRKDKSPQDFTCGFASNPSNTKDVSKGWYDAGDPNKYVNTGAGAASILLTAYEMYPKTFSDNQNIPESGNNIPDILDEVRWELEWILKMQEASSGGFYCCVSFSEGFTNGQRFIMDTKGDVTNIKSTNDTAAAVAVLAQAALLYSKYDEPFAKQCLEAANKGWAFLLKNPSNIRAPGGAYPTDNDECTRFFAATSLYRTNGDLSCHEYIKSNYKKAYESEYGDGTWGWENGFYSYMKSQNRDSTIEKWFNDNFTKWANNKINRCKSNPWGNVIENGNYYWGSNSVILSCPREVLLGNSIFGTNSEESNKMARSSFNWILGANPLRKSFVSGYGDDSIKEIFNSWSEDGLPGIPKGIMPGGPNKYNGANISRFSAKCYMESSSEFTTNEHTLGWNSLLVFIAAFANTPLSPTTSIEPTATQTLQFVLGDVNKDGRVNSTDIALIERHLLGISSLKDEILIIADCTKDGKVSSTDISKIERYILGIIGVL